MKHVLVIGEVLLIGSGVEGILSREPDLIIKHSKITPENDLQGDIEFFKPDVIIIDENMNISAFSKLLSILKQIPGVRLMVLGVNENLVQIFDKQVVLIHQLADFVNEVR